MNSQETDDKGPSDTPYTLHRRRFRRVDISVRGGGYHSVEFVSSVVVDLRNPQAARQDLLKLRNMLLQLIPSEELASLDRAHCRTPPEPFVDVKDGPKTAPAPLLNAMRIQEQLTKGGPDAPGCERQPDQQGPGGGSEPKGKG